MIKLKIVTNFQISIVSENKILEWGAFFLYVRLSSSISGSFIVHWKKSAHSKCSQLKRDVIVF